VFDTPLCLTRLCVYATQPVIVSSTPALAALLAAGPDPLRSPLPMAPLNATAAANDSSLATFPGVPDVAAVALWAPSNGSTAPYAPVPYGPVVLSRSLTLGPFRDPGTGAVAPAAVQPTLHLGRTRTVWATLDTARLSLAMRNLTLTGQLCGGGSASGAACVCEGCFAFMLLTAQQLRLVATCACSLARLRRPGRAGALGHACGRRARAADL
jgi:hypothetical protein